MNNQSSRVVQGERIQVPLDFIDLVMVRDRQWLEVYNVMGS